MMPLFTNYRVTLIDTLPKNFLFIARIFTTEVQLKQNDKRLKNDPKTTVIFFDQLNLKLFFLIISWFLNRIQS